MIQLSQPLGMTVKAKTTKISVCSDFFCAILHRVSGEYGTKCTVDASGHRWTCSTGQSTFSCTVDDSGTRTLCADEQYCPYAEESQHIHISVYILWMEYFLVENFSKHFHLSEIGECLICSAHDAMRSLICLYFFLILTCFRLP